MSPDLPDKLLGLSIDEPGATPADAPEEEELVRFLYFLLGERRLAIAVDDVKTITDPPAELTRVPRSATAIEGVTDLRGEITAVLEPRVLFPVDGEPATTQQLIVFDRPTDRQPAAIRVDEVIGVETVPERVVNGPEALEDPEIAGGAIEHPLVTAIVERERTPGRPARRSHSADTGSEEAATARDRVTSRLEQMGRNGRRDGDEFTVADEESAGEQSVRPSEPVVVEATPLIDVDRLLRAAGAVD